MFENLRVANSNEAPKEGEWVELKEQAPAEVVSLLEKKGLPLSMEGVSLADAFETSEQVKALIEEVSYDEAGDVINENRYKARELGIYGNYVDQYVSFQQAPRPSFMQSEADNVDHATVEKPGNDAIN